MRFDVDVPEVLEVSADRTRLRQLLTNVLDNAVRHSPEGGRVLGHAAAPSGDRWRLDVADEGPGVAPADRERAFERFGTLTAPDAGDRGTGGTGLGLAIARWVAGAARRHGPLRRPATRHGRRACSASTCRSPARHPVHPTTRPPRRLPCPRTRPAAPTALAADPPRPPGHATVPPAPVLDPVFGRFWPDHRGRAPRRGAGRRRCRASSPGSCCRTTPPGSRSSWSSVAAGLTVAYAATHRRDAVHPDLPGAGRARARCRCVLLDATWIGVLCLLAGATRAGRRGVPRRAGSTSSCWPASRGRSPASGTCRGWAARLRTLTGHGSAPRVLVTAIWSALALLVFGLLFVSADAIVASWVDTVLPDITVDSIVLRGLRRRRGRRRDPRRGVPRPQPAGRARCWASGRAPPVAHRFEWLVPVLLVDAVFAVFVAAQLSVLFGGHDYVQRTTGLTYAEYVHQGFGQLTVATLLTFLVVWAASHWAGDTRADRVWLRGSLGLLCALTLVVVGSALYRMHLYQEAYGFTRLRLFVDIFEGWLGLVVVAVAVAGVVRWGVWVPRFALVTGVAALLGPRASSTRTRGSPSRTWTGTPTPAGSTGTTCATCPRTPCPSSRARRRARGRAAGMPRYWSQDDDWLSLEPRPQPGRLARSMAATCEQRWPRSCDAVPSRGDRSGCVRSRPE